MGVAPICEKCGTRHHHNVPCPALSAQMINRAIAVAKQAPSIPMPTMQPRIVEELTKEFRQMEIKADDCQAAIVWTDELLRAAKAEMMRRYRARKKERS